MTDALADLFQQYYQSLVRMLYRRTGDAARAEDIAQEVFARAAACPPRNPRPWLFAVALNLLREQGRTEARRGRLLELYREEGPQHVPAPDRGLERAESVDRVKAALALLTERDREALLLQAEGFDYEEIAATLGLAKGAIGTTLARARKRLVETYRGMEKGERHAAS